MLYKLYELYKFKIFTFARYWILQFLLSIRGYKLFILIIEIFIELYFSQNALFHHGANMKDT